MLFSGKPIKAYLYGSTTVKAISGIMYLNNKVSVESWKEKYSYDKTAIKRIDDYLCHYKYAMEIISFQDTNKISVDR